MKDILEFLVKGITGCEKFDIEENINEEGFEEYILKLPQEYIGMVIGKQGKTIKAIRNLLKVKATLEKKRFHLNVVPLA